MLGQVDEITTQEIARILLSHLLLGNVIAESLRLLLNLLLRYVHLVAFSRCRTCWRCRYCTNDDRLLSLSCFTKILTMILTYYTTSSSHQLLNVFMRHFKELADSRLATKIKDRMISKLWLDWRWWYGNFMAQVLGCWLRLNDWHYCNLWSLLLLGNSIVGFIFVNVHILRDNILRWRFSHLDIIDWKCLLLIWHRLLHRLKKMVLRRVTDHMLWMLLPLLGWG